ncbi:MAG: hypothetical protein WCF84_06965 [Anaerolineae bacterium]
MKNLKLFALMALLALTVMVMSACNSSAPASNSGGGTSGGATSGGSAAIASLNDMPAYPNAAVLKPGENKMADTLAQNVSTAAGMGQRLDQRMYSLPKGATWDAVKSFYSDKITAGGWQAVNTPSVPNQMFQFSIFRKGTQSLTVAVLTDPTTNDNFLLFSMAN